MTFSNFILVIAGCITSVILIITSILWVTGEAPGIWNLPLILCGVYTIFNIGHTAVTIARIGR